MLRLKEGPNQPGPIFSTLYITFVQFFSLINYSLQDPHYICPQIFLFLRPHFATPLMTHIRNSPFATHIRNSRFATPLATHVCDSCS